MVADLIALAPGLGADASDRPTLHASRPRVLLGERHPVVPMEDLICRYYLRLSVGRGASALAQAAQTLAENAVAVASVVQRKPDSPWGQTASSGETASEMVIVTQPAREGDMRQALRSLVALPEVRAISSLIRVE
jgi:homoserine dehydrogenase